MTSRVESLTIGEARKKIKEECATVLADHSRIMVNIMTRSGGQSVGFVDSSAKSSTDSSYLPATQPLDEPNPEPFELPLLANADKGPGDATKVTDAPADKELKALTAMPSPFEVLPSQEEHEARVAAAQTKVDDLEASGKRSELLEAKIELNSIKAYRFDNTDPEPFQRLVDLRQQQLLLVEEELSNASDGRKANLIQKQKSSVMNSAMREPLYFDLKRRKAFARTLNRFTRIRFTSTGTSWLRVKGNWKS